MRADERRSPAGGSALVVVSNRGPLAFSTGPDGNLVAGRGAGGLASSLAPLLRGSGVTWVAAAISDADREAAADGVVEADGFRLRSLALDPDEYRLAYDVVSNATLWFLHHGLFDLARRPRIDRHWRRAWEAYRAVNAAFAAATAEVAPPGATVLVQDYHFALLPERLAEARPDCSVVHFSHTPFGGPDALAVLPAEAAAELLTGMAAATACGFHTSRWARRFAASCEEVLGRAPTTFVAPLGPDADELARVAASEECRREGERLEAAVGERRLVFRADRMELSKNLLRGFLAYEELLRTRPEWREQVVFVASAYASRQGLVEYLAYRQEVETLVERINRTWARPGWTPILLDLEDNYPRTVAALQRYDALLVNPVRDGLNLVAKEGPLLNRRDGALALSREAGAFDEVGDAAFALNPFDVSGTALALGAALDLPPAERAARAASLREAAGRRTPRDWLDDQLAAAASHPAG